MAIITGQSAISSIDLYHSETVPAHELGQKIEGSNGSVFKYVKAGELLVVGDVVQGPAFTTDHIALAVVSGTAGSREVVVTLANSAVTKNQYAGGMMSINVTPGLGQTYTIESHPAQTSATGNVTLTLREPLRTTLSTATRVAIKKSPFNGVIQSPATTLTGVVVGVAIYAIPSGEYGWIQTRGVTSVKSDNTTLVVGHRVETSLSVAGAIAVEGTVGTTPLIGIAMQLKDNGKVILCDLRID